MIGVVVGVYLGSVEGECSETVFEPSLGGVPQVASECHNQLGVSFAAGPHAEEFSILLCALGGAIVFGLLWHLFRSVRQRAKPS